MHVRRRQSLSCYFGNHVQKEGGRSSYPVFVQREHLIRLYKLCAKYPSYPVRRVLSDFPKLFVCLQGHEVGPGLDLVVSPFLRLGYPHR